MDALKKFFPLSWRAVDVNGLVVSLIVYVVAAVIGGFVIGLLAAIPIIGILFSLLGALVDLYALIGIVLAVLVFTKILK